MKRNRISNFIKLLFLTLLLYFVGKTIIQQSRKIYWETITVDYMFLVLAITSDILTRFFSGILYSTLLRRLNTSLPVYIAISISWISLLGKYIPGKIAVLGSAIFLLSRYKVKPEISALVPMLANGMVVITCLILSLPLFFYHRVGATILPFSQAWFFMLLFIGTIAIHPKIIIGMANCFFRLMKRPIVQTELTLKQLFLPYCIVLLQCFFSGMTTWNMIKALTSIDCSAFPMVVSISVLAGTLGFLAFFSPAGLGIREGVYLLTLSPIVGSDMASLTAVCLRLLQTLIDILMAILGLGLLRLTSDQQEVKK